MLMCCVVSYDVREARRLRKVFKGMRNYGDHTQTPSSIACSPRRTWCG